MALLSTIDSREFKYDFYSGSNIGLWMGGQLLSHAVGVEYSLVQTKMPLYGYASSLYDGVADGVVQVSGVLWLNFTQAQAFPSYIEKASQGGQIRTFETTDILDVSSRLDTGLSDVLNNEKAELLKNVFWQNNDIRQTEWNLDKVSKIPVRYGRPDQHAHGFDIIITYGSPFGDRNIDQDVLPINSTVRVVRNVRITGFGQTISVDGQPVLEQYPFLARSVT